MSTHLKRLSYQAGFSLVEIMVGLVIGLIATLVIMQTFSAFEGNKRSTTGIADTQTNGSIGLYMVQRELQFAGYGVPVASGTLPEIKESAMKLTYEDYTDPALYPTQASILAAQAAKTATYDANLVTEAAKIASGVNFSALKCNPAPILNLDADDDPLTPDVPVDIITPVTLTDGAAGNDTITIQYGTTSRGAMPTSLTTIAGVNQVGVSNNLGCRPGDVVLVVGNSNSPDSDTACVGSKVTSVEVTSGTNTWLDTVGNSNQILVTNNVGMYNPGKPRKLACLGQIRQSIFDINGNELRKNNRPVVTEIVAMQAQYGISPTANSEHVTQWVSATGAVWGASPIPVASRNRIKAVRVALVARNNLLERDVVSQACTGAAVGPAKVCIWGNQDVNLPDANWANYRYRAYEIVIPLRNVLAASPQL
jgi:type IV pilus assembly protein PilW